MSAASPTVSVVIPCYNAEAFVAEAVASALDQTYPLEEVICVDDGSTDGTLGVLERLQADAGERLIVLSRSNGGPSAARNLGLSRATGDYVQFLDADDLLRPEKIAHQIGLIRVEAQHPDLVAAAYEVVFGDAGTCAVIGLEESPWLGVFVAKLGITSANLYRREAVERVGGWNEGWRTSEDPELAFRLLKDGARVLLDPVPATTLRRRGDSQWSADVASSHQGWLRLRMEILDWVRAHRCLSPEEEQCAERKLFGYARKVHTYDPGLAEEALSMLPASFRPEPARHGRAYTLLYRAFGFDGAQRLYPFWLRINSAIRAPARASS